jgi:hypothetical protein
MPQGDKSRSSKRFAPSGQTSSLGQRVSGVKIFLTSVSAASASARPHHRGRSGPSDSESILACGCITAKPSRKSGMENAKEQAQAQLGTVAPWLRMDLPAMHRLSVRKPGSHAESAMLSLLLQTPFFFGLMDNRTIAPTGGRSPRRFKVGLLRAGA